MARWSGRAKFAWSGQRAAEQNGRTLMIRNGSGNMSENEIREALDRHWAASDANEFEVEHDIYREDAVLEYPQSGERIRGRRNIQASRTVQPNSKRFSVRRITGKGDLWVTEFILTYDGQPSYTVSIMEFLDGRVARETQYFGDPFEPGPSRAHLVERIEASRRDLGAPCGPVCWTEQRCQSIRPRLLVFSSASCWCGRDRKARRAGASSRPRHMESATPRVIPIAASPSAIVHSSSSAGTHMSISLLASRSCLTSLARRPAWVRAF